MDLVDSVLEKGFNSRECLIFLARKFIARKVCVLEVDPGVRD